MKINCDLRVATCTQTQLSKAIGVSTARINQLINEGVVIRALGASQGAVLVFESIKNYYSHQYGRTGSGVNFNDEKALHMKAKRELAELTLAKAKGELYEAAAVEKTLVEIFTTLRTQLLMLPAVLSPQLANKSCEEICDILSAEIEQKLTTLAELDFSSFRSDGVDE